MDDLDFLPHDECLGEAFLAGTNAVKKQRVFEDFPLHCDCAECHSEFARGYAVYLNYQNGRSG